jgi:hypothetical protein
MPRSMVGLLAAVGATMFALAPSARGVLFLLAIAVGAAATGLAAYEALCAGNKKNLLMSVSSPVAASLRRNDDSPRSLLFAPFS